MKDRLDLWAGDFGTDYHKDNPFTAGNVELRRKWLWDVLRHMLDGPPFPSSILEVGCGQGENLSAWNILRPDADIWGVEPNVYAAERARTCGATIVNGTLESPRISDKIGYFDLVMDCGVLIHIPTDGLIPIMTAMHRLSKRYILSAEYFHFRELEPKYREPNACWLRPYGDIWMDLFALKPVRHGYLWHRTTGLDNLTWHLFEKAGYKETE